MVKAGTKTAGPIRRGFEYQDLIALMLALELYIENRNFQMYLEYGKPGGLDDIVIILDDEIHAYQVKHAENPFDVYGFGDFTKKTRRNVCFSAFSAFWARLKEEYPQAKVVCRLLSNRSLGSSFTRIVDRDGCFSPGFIRGAVRSERRIFRKDLMRICELDTQSFEEFLGGFRFDLNQRSLTELEDHVKGFLLDHRLGISNPAVFLELRSHISRHAQESSEPISSDFFDRLLWSVESKYILPQRFEVDASLFVRLSTFWDALDSQLTEADGEYIVVTGLPGSGKSTSVTAYLDEIEDDDRYICVRYYCFVNINDNQQRQRLEAQSLRVNILSELQRHFSHILDRRFDFSEGNFTRVLEQLGEHFWAEGKKLVLLLDGLDHAEKEADVLQDVLSALPRQIPQGVVLLIGTQELRHWKPLALRKGREDRHIEMPLFSMKEIREFFTAHGIRLSDEKLQLIQNKSEGLPLYLMYIAQGLLQAGEQFDLETHPEAKDGHIRTYYESLWDKFDSSGMGKAKYLCKVAACLDFRVHVDEFIDFQNELGLSDFDEALRTIMHLLRIDDNMMSLFHPSFRLFINSKMSSSERERIVRVIYEKLRGEEKSDRWYRHVLKYAFYAGDYDYILSKVNKRFVDDALASLRADKEIIEAIDRAVESAKASDDLVALARLGSLHYRTHERLQSLDRALLGKTLLNLGRKDEVLGFSFERKNNRWLVSQDVALDLIIWHAETGNFDIGRKLFQEFVEASWDSIDLQHDVRGQHNYATQMAKCLAIYGRHRIRHLRWLSGFKFRRDPVLWDIDYFAPSYAPHLEAYIEAAIKFRDEKFWRRIIRVGKVFDSKTVRYFAIRTFARCGLQDQLADEITAYLEKHPDTKNSELAVYAAQAGLPTSLVSKISGVVHTPKMSPPERETRQNYRMALRRPLLAAAVMTYVGAEKALQETLSKLAQKDSLWTRVLRFITLAGGLLGRVYRGEEQGLANSACEAIDHLDAAEQAEGERIADTLDAIRALLPDILHDLTLPIARKENSQLKKWAQRLLSLRQSSIWQTHYGINEISRNYSFELAIWERLAEIAAFRTHLASIVTACENEYRSVTTIKGGSRSYHFLRLAGIAARCGLYPLAERCIRAGIEATNVYGYRKDATLSLLMDVMDLLNPHKPQTTLSRCSAVLEMAKWMRHVTDGSGTQGFPVETFSLVLKTNRTVALDLIRHFFRHCPRWMALDCLEKYIRSSDESDPEFLWALCELFAPHSTEAGRHPAQVLRVRQHVAEIAQKGSCETDEWSKRLELFIRTHITPRYWPEELQRAHGFTSEPENQKSPEGSYRPDDLILNGVKRSIEEIKAGCIKSFGLFRVTISKLRAENEHFWEYDLNNYALTHHIAAASTPGELLPIKEYTKEQGVRVSHDVNQMLAKKFGELGDVKNSCEACELAISSNTSWRPHKDSRRDFETIAGHSQARLRQIVMQKCYDDLKTSYGGFEVPVFVATALDVLGDAEGLEQVFNNYLTHCQELFAHLPKTPMYAWLNDDCVTEKDERSEICGLLLDELDTAEIDLGDRLIRAIVALALKRTEIVWSIILSYLKAANGLQKTRLFSAVQSIGYAEPALIRRDWRIVWKSANVPDLRHKLLAMNLLDAVYVDKKRPKALQASVDRAKRELSSTIYVSTYRPLHVDPATEFTEFSKKGALIDFHRQLEAVADVLHLDHPHILADLERRLRTSGWTLSVAEKERKEDWEYHVHPQGWPVVWTIPRFHTRICTVLYEVTGEYAEKMKFKDWQLEAVWRIIQPSDPEYYMYRISPKPGEVPFLAVEDKAVWFHELSTRDSFQKRELSEEIWVILFESRKLSQDKRFERPFVSYLMTVSSLVEPALTLDSNQIQAHAEWSEDISFCHPYESMTWKQARAILTQSTRNPTESLSLPAVSMKENPILFTGFHYIASLPSWLIRDFDLVFREPNLFRGKTQVTRFDYWQGGYVDEAYSRERLSEGTRVLVRVDFLKEVLDSIDMRLCRKLTERRIYYDSMHNKKPDDEISKTVIEVF